jgi:hypothetical protein
VRVLRCSGFRPEILQKPGDVCPQITQKPDSEIDTEALITVCMLGDFWSESFNFLLHLFHRTKVVLRDCESVLMR